MTPQPTNQTASIEVLRTGSRFSRRSSDQYVGRRTWDPETFRREAALSHLRVAEPDELPETHQLAEEIMGRRLAPLWSLASAHAHTTAAAWVHRDPDPAADAEPKLTGLFLVLPLNWDGEAALRNRRLNFAAPRIDQLCAPGDEIAALYFWLTAGSDRRARRNVMRTALAWVSGASTGIRFYAQAASADGARALAGLQFRPLAPDSPNMFLLERRS